MLLNSFIYLTLPFAMTVTSPSIGDRPTMSVRRTLTDRRIAIQNPEQYSYRLLSYTRTRASGNDPLLEFSKIQRLLSRHALFDWLGFLVVRNMILWGTLVKSIYNMAGNSCNPGRTSLRNEASGLLKPELVDAVIEARYCRSITGRPIWSGTCPRGYCKSNRDVNSPPKDIVTQSKTGLPPRKTVQD